jgi:hypothetical protein
MSDVSDTDLLRDTGAEVPAFLKANLALLIVPSVLLGVGAAMDAWVSSLHAVAPAVVSIVKGIGWGVYFRLAMRASGGVESAGFVTPIVCMVLAFVALEYGDLALVLPVIIWVLPIIDYAGMYGEGPEGALGGVLDTLKAAPGLWLGTTFALLVALIMFGLVLSLPMSIYSTYAHREGAWLANLSGGVLVGPLVHVAVVFRERLFLAIHGDPA